ncbi:MAG: S9 family peptidase [Draconibacterium sp.]|nr:MAG: S9 family peptidase [Draconibacterium sp.]
MKRTILNIALLIMIVTANMAQDDPYLWLEEVENPKALEWVQTWNEKSLDVLKNWKNYNKVFEKNLEIYNSDERIADPVIYGKFIFNFWQDNKHERGIWRRTSLDNYIAGNPDWETILDIDKLSEQDSLKWVFKGAEGLYPDYNRFLISLSKGGGDAVVVREFDVAKKSFVKDGFYLPEAKGAASWIDSNTILVSTDFGNGITTSGYPKEVKSWKRGTPLSDAKLLYKGKETDMGVWGMTKITKSKTYQIISRRISFYSGELYVVNNGNLVKLELPKDIEFSGIFKKMFILQLKSDMDTDNGTFKQGSVVSIGYNDLIAGKKNFQLVFSPDEHSSVSGLEATSNTLLINILNNVKSELHKYTWDGSWKSEKINAPEYGNITLSATDPESDNYFFYFTNFLEPSSLYYGDANKKTIIKIKSLASFFPADKYKVNQYEAISKDGTRIPYFVVGSKDMKLNGKNAALLYAYGGFEIPILPSYNAVTGTAWLEEGGVYVLANIRGGGEFGPQWHQAGLKQNRQRVYDDFFAVAQSLIDKKITSPEKLGIFGGSNGGLLVGVAFTQRPDLFNAVVCAVPLLDMKRYNKLLAGASWMAEYGNPDIPEEWEFISKYSPYQNIKANMIYPEVFFTTSTRDDRVHPGHARKTVAKMNDLGYKIYYFENTEGGHAGASTNDQRAQMYALIFSYLQMKLMND